MACPRSRCTKATDREVFMEADAFLIRIVQFVAFVGLIHPCIYLVIVAISVYSFDFMDKHAELCLADQPLIFTVARSNFVEHLGNIGHKLLS